MGTLPVAEPGDVRVDRSGRGWVPYLWLSQGMLELTGLGEGWVPYLWLIRAMLELTGLGGGGGYLTCG